MTESFCKIMITLPPITVITIFNNLALFSGTSTGLLFEIWIIWRTKNCRDGNQLSGDDLANFMGDWSCWRKIMYSVHLASARDARVFVFNIYQTSVQEIWVHTVLWLWFMATFLWLCKNFLLCTIHDLLTTFVYNKRI